MRIPCRLMNGLKMSRFTGRLVKIDNILFIYYGIYLISFNCSVQIPIANESYLQIRKASLADAGMYKCKASNIVSTTELRFAVEVHGKL